MKTLKDATEARPVHAIAATMLLATCAAAPGFALAGEGFQVRYNLVGSLGGEMFAPPDQTGWAAGMAATHLDVNKVSGDDGGVLTAVTPGGRVPVPGAPAAAYPQYGANTVQVYGTGTFKLVNLALGYVSTDRYNGGRLAFLVNVPLGEKAQYFDVRGATPALTWNAPVLAAAQGAVNAGFHTQYQAGLAAQAAGETGKVGGIGDTELQAGWLYVDDRWRVLAGASVVFPTGKYSSSGGPDIGFGNFITLRPSAQLAYMVTPDFSMSGKFTVGINTRNKDKELHSGNWLGAEFAAGYKTQVGVIGVHGIRIQQIQDDRNNPWGASRFRSSNAGLFFTTVIPGVNAAATLQVMASTNSRNAKHGNFSQLRIAKVF